MVVGTKLVEGVSKGGGGVCGGGYAGADLGISKSISSR